MATHQVLYAFDLPYTKKLVLELPVPMKVDLVNVMVPVDGIKLKSEQLTDGGIQDNQGVKFKLFTGSNLSSGSTLKMSLSGNTSTSQASADSKIKINPVLFGAGIFLFALSGVGLYFYQKQKSPLVEQNDSGNSIVEDRESIMDAIIVLDNLYKEGKLKEDIYSIRREELKNKLKSSHVIQVRKLIKRFGPKTVLNQLSLEVADGEFVAILGPNGAGKTTLLRILSSLSKPTFGEISIAGFSLPSQSASVRQRLGVVSHLPLLYGDLTAAENLVFYGRMFAVPSLTARVDQVLKLVGLSHRAGDLVRTFSRGMQQRLAIGRAVLHDPEVLLLDEPHTGLDQDACDMLDEVLKEVAVQGRTVLMTSHDFVRVQNLAN